VLTKPRGCLLRFASAETELVCSHEVSPLEYLLKLPERRGKDETSYRIAVSVCAVGVEFTACVAFWDVETRQIASTSDLDKVRCLHEMGTFDGSVRDQTSAVPIIHAPRDFEALGIPNV